VRAWPPAPRGRRGPGRRRRPAGTDSHPAGDHTLHIGHVDGLWHEHGDPLVFFTGSFHALDVVVIPFTRAPAALTHVEFCALLTEHLDMRSLYVGEDFALGRRRAGTPDRLRELGLDVWTNRASPTHTARARRAPRTSAGRSPSAPMRTSRSPQPDRTTITARRNGSC